MNETFLGDSLLDPEKPVQEKDLIAPILLILAQAKKTPEKTLSTYQIYTALKDIFVMSDEDQEVLRRGKVTRFMRTVQNALSHDLLTRDNWAKRIDAPYGVRWEITPRGCAQLLDRMLDPVQQDGPKEINEITPEGALSDGERVLENVVAFYTLVRLAELQKDNKRPVPITQLRKDVKMALPLSVQDLEPLKNRSDTKIDQIFRNIISHNTLTKNGWATRYEKGLAITIKGKAHVLDNILETFPAPDFSFLLKAEQEFRSQVNRRRAEVAAEAAAKRKMKQK